MRGSHLGMRTPRMGGGVVNAEFARPRANGGQETMRGSHLGMRTPRMGGALSTRSSHAHGRTAARRRCAVRIWGCELRGWGGRCQRGVRTPTGERRPGDDARFASGDANSADGGGVVNAEFARPRANGGQETMRGSHLGMRTPRMGGALSTRSSHAHGRTAARRRCAVRIWGCELRGWGGRCQRGVRTPTGERRPGDDARFASGDANSADGGGRCQRGVRTPTGERRPGDDARFASGDANSADGGGVVNAEFARPRANGGQETMRGSHLGMRTPRMGGGVVNAEFARPRANGGQETMRGSHLGMRTPRMGGGVVNAEFARPRANGGQETMRGSHLGMRTPRMGGALSTRSSHALVRTTARRRCAVRIWGCELRGWGGCCQRGVRTPTGERRPGDDARFASGDANSADGGGRCQRGVRTPTGERRPGDDARFASGDANSADGGGVVNAEFARPRANGGQETMRGSHLGMRTPRMGGGCCQRGVRTPTGERRPGDDARFASGDANSADGGGVVNAEFARPRANDGQETMRGSHLGMRTPRMGGVLSTRSSHAHGRTAARRRCAVRIWGCELRGWGGALSTRSSHAHGRTAARRRCAVRIWGCELRGWGGRCQRGVRTPTGERRPGDDARFASGDANSADGGGRCQRGVRTPTGERRPGDDARFASGDANSADGGGVVNAEFARPRANGGQETMRGSHLGMRTPRMGGALSTRSSHAHGRTAARRRCAVRIWGCELRGWGGVLSPRSSHAHVRTAVSWPARCRRSAPWPPA
jgi:hypothetical protein